MPRLYSDRLGAMNRIAKVLNVIHNDVSVCMLDHNKITDHVVSPKICRSVVLMAANKRVS